VLRLGLGFRFVLGIVVGVRVRFRGRVGEG